MRRGQASWRKKGLGLSEVVGNQSRKKGKGKDKNRRVDGQVTRKLKKEPNESKGDECRKGEK